MFRLFLNFEIKFYLKFWSINKSFYGALEIIFLLVCVVLSMHHVMVNRTSFPTCFMGSCINEMTLNKHVKSLSLILYNDLCAL
jgi:hypothetical protein